MRKTKNKKHISNLKKTRNKKHLRNFKKTRRLRNKNLYLKHRKTKKGGYLALFNGIKSVQYPDAAVFTLNNKVYTIMTTIMDKNVKHQCEVSFTVHVFKHLDSFSEFDSQLAEIYDTDSSMYEAGIVRHGNRFVDFVTTQLNNMNFEMNDFKNATPTVSSSKIAFYTKKNNKYGKNITIKYTTETESSYPGIISAGGELKTYYFKLVSIYPSTKQNYSHEKLPQFYKNMQQQNAEQKAKAIAQQNAAAAASALAKASDAAAAKADASDAADVENAVEQAKIERFLLKKAEMDAGYSEWINGNDGKSKNYKLFIKKKLNDNCITSRNLETKLTDLYYIYMLLGLLEKNELDLLMRREDVVKQNSFQNKQDLFRIKNCDDYNLLLNKKKSEILKLAEKTSTRGPAAAAAALALEEERPAAAAAATLGLEEERPAAAAAALGGPAAAALGLEEERPAAAELGDQNN